MLLMFLLNGHLTEPHYTWIKHFDKVIQLYFLLALFELFYNEFHYQAKGHFPPKHVLDEPLLYLVSLQTIQLAGCLVSLAAMLTCIDERFTPLWNELATFYPDVMQSKWDKQYVVTDLHERAHYALK